MGRPRSPKRAGALETLRDAKGRTYYRGKVTLKDGTRERVDELEPFQYSKQDAKTFLAQAQKDEDEGHARQRRKDEKQEKAEAAIAGAPSETCDAWYERFFLYRQKERPNSKGPFEDRRTWRRSAKLLREKPMRTVSPDDIEDVRDELNTLVDAYEAAGCMSGPGRLSYSSVGSAWCVITTTFKYASTRKGPRELRVREDLGNPCLGIEPPRRGPRKERRWLRPYEVNAVIAWLAVQGESAWAEAIAIGYYLHLRPSELHELRAKDVDVVAGEVSITRAYDERTGTIGPPKSGAGVRTITIHSALLPLLARLLRDRHRDDLLCPIVAATPESPGGSGVSRATLIRALVEKAGVERASELFEETRTHVALDFRCVIRDSGITARFLADHKSEDVQRESGHEHISTTLGYAKEVKNRQGRYGDPFGALPAALVAPTAPAAPSHAECTELADPPPSDEWSGVLVQVPVQVTAKYAESLLRLLDSNQRPGG